MVEELTLFIEVQLVIYLTHMLGKQESFIFFGMGWDSNLYIIIIIIIVGETKRNSNQNSKLEF